MEGPPGSARRLIVGLTVPAGGPLSFEHEISVAPADVAEALLDVLGVDLSLRKD